MKILLAVSVVLLGVIGSQGHAASKAKPQAAPPTKWPSVFVGTVPKSGTHLLFKALTLITGTQWQFHMSKWEGHPVVACHLNRRDRADMFASDKWRSIVLYRDPRDAIISQLHYIIDRNYHWLHTFDLKGLQRFKALPQEQQISFLINLSNGRDINWFSREALKWRDAPRILSICFEDLIGSKGGGDDAQQRVALEQIGSWLGYNMSEKQLTHVADNLFGDSKTFRSGQIGNWQNYFTEAHKVLFKQKMGDLLIDLGYEKDYNW